MKATTLLDLQYLYPNISPAILEEIADKDLAWVQKIRCSVKDKNQMVDDIIKIRRIKNF